MDDGDTLTTSARLNLSLSASGSTAILGYARATSTDLYAAYRRTTDKGSHWTSEASVGIVAAAPSGAADVSVVNGTYRAVYEQCATSACSASSVVYRSSANGTTWTSPVVVSTGTRPYNFPAGVGPASGRTIVIYNDLRESSDDGDVLCRSGS